MPLVVVFASSGGLFAAKETGRRTSVPINSGY